MKQLFVSIEDIHIIGSANDLSEIVTVMDQSLQVIADYSEQLTGILHRYSSTIKGKQFQNTVETAKQLREEVYKAAVEMNNMQNQIVEYQYKINRFEDEVNDVAIPNHFEVTQAVINPETAEVQMTRSELERLVLLLEEYETVVYQQLRIINEKKDDIGNIWKDTQYMNFSEFIDELSVDLSNAIKVYDDFLSYLKERILELS